MWLLSMREHGLRMFNNNTVLRRIFGYKERESIKAE
jgi:hypothetical protein